MQARLLAVAPNGARRMPSDHPDLPVTSEAQARTAKACLEAGAGMIHLHVRDDDGGHTLDPVRYREAMAAIREAVGDALVIQITTESCGLYDRQAQMDCVAALRPEACSAALRELCPGESEADRTLFAGFLGDCADEGIAVQHILYDARDVDHFRRLRAAGLIPGERPFVLLVVGRRPEDDISPERQFLALVDAVTVRGADEVDWMLCAFGEHQVPLTAAAAALGGHVRIGFENGLQRAGGAVAGSNAELVAASAGFLRSLGLAPMSGPLARQWLAP